MSFIMNTGGPALCCCSEKESQKLAQRDVVGTVAPRITSALFLDDYPLKF